MTELAGVLFDMDGTLLDSEKLWDLALEDTARWLGGELSEAARQAMVGSNMAVSIVILHGDLDIEANPEASAAYLTQRTAEHFARPIPWRTGAQDLVRAVHDAAIPAALVTSTHRHLADLALRTIGAENFAAVICGDEVDHPKPDPEPYLRAAHMLGVDPRACVAIEDSLTGLASAEAAGCRVIAVPCEIAIPYSPRRTRWESLQGRTVEDLRQLVATSRR
jgi:HAD superfamily hydrolase (TIGR01509 family)